jgi:hypothetical protein
MEILSPLQHLPYISITSVRSASRLGSRHRATRSRVDRRAAPRIAQASDEEVRSIYQI